MFSERRGKLARSIRKIFGETLLTSNCKIMIRVFVLISLLLITESAAMSQAVVGNIAPPFSADEWLKGEPVNSFESGTVYLVEFWGTWCSPCIKNIPHLSELQKKYASKGLVVIGVASHEFDGREALDKFMSERGDEMEYRVAYDKDLSMEQEWDTGKGASIDKFRLPVCFLVDRDGKIAIVCHPENEELSTLLKKMFEE
jgi:thiol-disulfide isomerase/thioredoxin